MASDRQVEIEIHDCEGGRSRLKMNAQDSLIIGRGSDCDQVVAGDRSLSRHHFLLEVNQANVTLRDLGIRNGTLVNGRKLGPGTGGDEEDGNWTVLKDGDKVQAGRTTFIVRLKSTPRCIDCGSRIPAGDRKEAEYVNGTYLCRDCRSGQEARARREKRELAPAPVPSPVFVAPAPERPVEPGRPLRPPRAPEPRKINDEQRNRAEKSPAEVVEELLRNVFNIGEPEAAIPAVGGYRDLVLLGKGAFGAVYKATRAKDGATVALKTMLQTRQSSECDCGLFEREQEIVCQLNHPNIVAAYACGQWEDIHFIEMEYIAGGSLWDRMKQSPGIGLPLPDMAGTMLQVAAGLAYAHTAQVTVTTRRGRQETVGVVHRDMKPPNIMIDDSGPESVAKISDYGLAKAFELSGMTLGRLSHRGMWRGTAFYMAREHFVKYQYVEPVTDVFETAATFFHALTGRGVWPLTKNTDPHRTILESVPRRIRDFAPSLPRKLQDMFDNALTETPDNRIQNGQELLRELEAAL